MNPDYFIFIAGALENFGTLFGENSNRKGRFSKFVHFSLSRIDRIVEESAPGDFNRFFKKPFEAEVQAYKNGGSSPLVRLIFLEAEVKYWTDNICPGSLRMEMNANEIIIKGNLAGFLHEEQPIYSFDKTFPLPNSLVDVEKILECFVMETYQYVEIYHQFLLNHSAS